MRVALVTDGIWPYVLGGMQRHSYYVCKYLAQNKVHVHLYHFNQSQYDILKLEFFSAEELKYIEATVIDFPKSLPFPGHYLYNSFRYSKLIFEHLQKNIAAYDFIYTKGFAGWHLINSKAAGKVSCAPIGVKFHGYEMFQRSPDFKIKLQHVLLLRKPVRNISMKADVVFSYGGKITDIIRSIGVKPEKIFELPSGVEKDTLAQNIRPTEAIIRFLFLGRYERRKGIEELNQAITGLLASGQQNFEFQFIGPIPADKQLSQSQVIYHGEIRSKEGLQALVKKCDVLVCPSWSEGMPNVILEAMANGLAVVATDVGATNVLVDEDTGWLLKSPAPEEIEATLAAVLKMPASAIDEKKKNALALMTAHFTWEQLISRLSAFLQSQKNSRINRS